MVTGAKILEGRKDPESYTPTGNNEDLEEYLRSESTLVVTSNDSGGNFMEVSRWSTLDKGIWVVGWSGQFVFNACHPHSERCSGPLSEEEIKVAERRLISFVQQSEFSEELTTLKLSKPVPKHSTIAKLDPCLGDDGLIRIGGRLERTKLSYDEKHPLILPVTPSLAGCSFLPSVIETCWSEYINHGN